MSMNNQNINEAKAAPVRVWGDLTAVYRERDFNAGSDKATDTLFVSTVNASSYIWQPWFALVDGNISVTSDNRENSDQVNVNNKYLRGKLRLNFFPSSRFPLLLYAEKTSNERYDELFARNIVNTVIGVRQQYISLDGRQYYSAKVERTEREDIAQESFTNELLDLKARYKMNNSILYANVDYSKIEKPTRDDAVNYAITARHSYANKSNLTLENTVSTTQSHSDFITNSSDSRNDQLSSFLLWRPEKNSNLNITASLRVSDLEQKYQQYDLNLTPNTAKQNQRATININQGLIYNYSPRITFTESLNGTQLTSDTSEQFIGSESVGATYNSGSIDNVIGFYNWYASTNLNRQHGNSMATEKFFKNQLGHSLSKEISITNKVKVQSTFNQSIVYDLKSSREDSSLLNHSVTASWSDSNFFNSSSLRFIFTDIRNMSFEDSSFQLINLQYFHNYRLSRNTFFIANITLQKSQNTTDQKTTNTQYTNGQLSYNNSHFINVLGLSFKSELRISNKVNDGEELTSTRYGAYRDNIWRNEIVYRIGLLESRASLDYVKNANQYDRVLKFQITRRFGDL
ncbi:hypothetical protein MNBD_GAMMA22-1950 [hydrothermal vent metagenome]|uniref:Uncharacterized protein n=1 Tax=hydrothermal vent metagenome TaxID=652676 RepID=A0A3B1A6S1_9ZZZZ